MKPPRALSISPDRIPAMVLAGCTVALLWSAPPAAGRTGEQSVQFTDVTRAARIGFVHSFGDTRLSNIIEGVGGGAAWLDYDQDGWIDLYLTTGRIHPGLSDGAAPAGTPRNTLYRNRGDGTFDDVTARAGVGCESCFSMGLAVGDFDNDGWPDIFAANHGADVLFRNQGNGTFRDVTSKAGVSSDACSVAATWLDYNKDGRLDLYVANYLEFDPKYRTYYSPDGFPGPLSYAPQPDSLYHNLGNGRFEDVSKLVRLSPPGRGMGVTAADWDGDGWDDIYVSNDGSENFLLHNLAGRRFEEIAGMAGVGFNGLGDVTASMAVDAGDFDNDGDLDLFVSDNAMSSLFRNEGPHFTDVAVESGIARTSAQFVGWGSFFFDIDNDGDLDIFKGNSDLSRPFGQEGQIYENNGSGLYREVGGRMGSYFQEDRMSRGAAFADFDNDGDADVVINVLGGPALLLRNDGGNSKHALSLRLVGRASNREGVGARVKVSAAGRTIVSEKRSSSGYLSQNDPRLLIGIGDAASADVEISWPSGRRQKLAGLPAGRTVTVEEPGS